MRNLGLDLVRIFAVVLVIGRHLHLPADAGWGLAMWQRGGWVGVDLFFVLSGFLVASLLFREYQQRGRVDIRRFLVRRALKIYPAFWLFLAASLVLNGWAGEEFTLGQVLSELLFFQNYQPGLWEHTWSLAVEEHFYLVLAVWVAWRLSVCPQPPVESRPVQSRALESLPRLFAITALICGALRLVNLAWFPEYSHRVYLYGTHLRLDALMFGAWLAYGWHFTNLRQRTQRIPSAALLAVAAALLSPAFCCPLESTRWLAVAGVILFYMAGGCLVLAALRWNSSRHKLLNALGGLGAASYSIYLWHILVASAGDALLAGLTQGTGPSYHVLYVLNAVVGACGFGWLLHRTLEQPVLALRDRLFPSRSVSANPSTGSSLFRVS